MYTQCPNCETIFRVTAEQLQVARGDVRCGDCNGTFNALESLTDHPPVAFDDTVKASMGKQHTPETDSGVSEELTTEDQPPYRPEDSLEFDVPEQNWSSFFIEAEPAPGFAPSYREASKTNNSRGAGTIPEKSEQLTEASDKSDAAKPAEPGYSPSDIDEAAAFEIQESGYADAVISKPTKLPHGARDQPPLNQENPPWIRDRVNQISEGDSLRRQSGFAWMTISLLAITFLAQLFHYNRDKLAANASYRTTVFSFYDRLGADLYPEWALDAFRVRGSEVIGGRGNALEIQAAVEIVGEHDVGLPMIRIMLRDRWSNAVAGQVFSPEEYFGKPGEQPDQLSAGALIPVKIRVVDPGAEAQGYEIDICLPRRNTGLQCQNDKNPFQQ